MMPILRVDRLSAVYETNQGPIVALDDVAIDVSPGEIVGLLGETGCGKSTLAHAILGTLPRRRAWITSGNICLDGIDMLEDSERARQARGRMITFVPQDTYSSLNPLFRIGTQIADLMRYTAPVAHAPSLPDTRRRHKEAALAMLEAVQLPDGPRILLQYPHQLSGGQRQRIMLAMALLPRPKVIIADEPIASLDAPIQLQILKLFRSVAAEQRVGFLFTTHSLGAAWEICDRIVVMHGGRVIEAAPRSSFFSRPLHPYTRRLFAAASRLAEAPSWISGDVPESLSAAVGCQLNSRCPGATTICREIRPLLGPQHAPHRVACHNPWTDGSPVAYE